LFFELEKEFTEKPPFYTQKNSAQLIEILIEIYKNNAFSQKKEDSFNAEEIAGYIREHLTEDINNSTIAEHFHFHKNYLSSQFARCYGKPIHQYILEMRIIRAVSLLESGRKSISEISESVGFKDANYFARYFKKITGISPTAYVNKGKKA
jgi:YesN/AraC family two-component response regulator